MLVIDIICVRSRRNQYSRKAEHVGFVIDTYYTIYKQQSITLNLTKVHAGEKHQHFCCPVQRVGHHVTGRVL